MYCLICDGVIEYFDNIDDAYESVLTYESYDQPYKLYKLIEV